MAWARRLAAWLVLSGLVLGLVGGLAILGSPAGFATCAPTDGGSQGVGFDLARGLRWNGCVVVTSWVAVAVGTALTALGALVWGLRRR